MPTKVRPIKQKNLGLVGILEHLVAFPTVSGDHATTQAALDWVEYLVRQLPLQVTRFEHEGYSSLVLTTRKTKHPKVLLLGHMDVVPAPAELYKLIRHGDRLTGRGVYDMKLAIASSLQLLVELGEDLPDYSLGVMITSDEEVGGMNGAGALVAAGWRADVVINPDAGASPRAWQLEQAAKGMYPCEVTSRGVAGHGSRPWAYRNAIEQLMDYLQDLRSKFPAEPCGIDDHRHNTLGVTVIEGGEAFNQVPDTAKAMLDVRLVPESSAAELDQLVRGTAAAHPGISVKQIVSAPPFAINPDHEYVQLLDLLVSKVAGKRLEYILSHGATDARFFAEQNIPVLGFRPPGGEQHSNHEWVSQKGLEQFHQIVREFVKQVALDR